MGSERLITEISGVEYFDAYDNQADGRSIDRFYYDDRDRLVRWVSDGGEMYKSDLELTYLSPDRISISGVRTSMGVEEPILAEVNLESGRVVRVDYTDEGTGHRNEIYQFSYSASDGTLAGCLLPPEGVSATQYEMSCVWSQGDWISLFLTPNPYSQNEIYEEQCRYGTRVNRANLDLNYLTYGTEFFSVLINQVSEMLGLAGLFGRNTHCVELSQRVGSDAQTRIHWEYDQLGYPVEWSVEFVDEQYPETNNSWRYTIHYDD